MSKARNGGSAFPHESFSLYAEGCKVGVVDASRGMLLRDYFAAKAAQGVLGNSDAIAAMKARTPKEITPVERIAAFAYELADAMLAAREAK